MQMTTKRPKKEKVTAPAEMLTVAEVAPKLGLRVSTVRAMLLRRKIPFVKLSARCVRIPRLEVEKLIRDHTIPSRAASNG
jgi:excisionase family DNA binding protein